MVFGGILPGLMLVCGSLLAQTVVWSGNDAKANGNTNWSDANNWTGGTPGPREYLLL